jgi:hypothetical protein
MRRKHKLVTVFVAMLVVFAGCATIGGDSGEAAGGSDGEEAAGGDAARVGGGDGGGGDGGGGGDASGSADRGGQAEAVSGQPLQLDRAIIRTGAVKLRVEDFEGARSSVAGHARSLDGFVSGSGSTHHTRDNQSWTSGYVVVRIPSERFSGMLSFARDRGTVLNEETQTEDVTDELVDLEARLENLDQRRDRLRSFYEQANSTRELLRIEEELSAVQSEIERLEAQRRSLERQVSYATLRIELAEPTPEPDDEPTTGASLVGAFRDSTATLIDYAYGFALFGVRLAPYLVVLGLPALAAGFAVRRRYGATLRWPGRSSARANRAQDPNVDRDTGASDEGADDDV